MPILSSVAELIMGQSPPSTTYNDKGIGLPFYQGKTDFGFKYPTPRLFCSSPNKIAEAGDILISVRAPVGPTNIASEKTCIGRGLGAIRAQNIDAGFLYFNLKYIEPYIASLGTGSIFKSINRHQLANVEVNPNDFELDEQRRIAYVLTTVQTAIEQQAKLIDLSRELKSALMKKLFTEGLRGEKQKETEIGFVPESWSVEKLSSLFMMKHGFGFKGEYFKPEGVHVLLTPGHFYEEGGFRDQGEKTKYYTGKIPDGFILREGDLLIAMTEQKAGLLGSSIIIPESDKYLHNQRLGLIQNLDSRIIKDFLFYYFNTSYPRRELFSTATGSKVRHTSPSKVLSLNIAFPKVEEQEQIVQILKTADQKLIVMNEKKLLLEELFRTLLHQLMTGQVRTADLHGLMDFADEKSAKSGEAAV